MDTIDITDSMFSLDTQNITKSLFNNINDCEIPNYIYIGLVVVLFIIGILFYKFYNNIETIGSIKSGCPIGFCNMNEFDQKET